MKRVKVFAGICIYKYWEPESRKSFDTLISESGKQSWELSDCVELYGESLISRGRNIIMKKFLKSKADYLFTYDADIVCFSNDAISLLTFYASHSAVTAAPYIYKNPPYRWAFRPYDIAQYDMRNIKNAFHVKYASSGCMMIPREIAEDIVKKYDEPYQPITNICGEYLSEDWAFCKRVSDLNYPILIMPQIKLGHIGQYIFTAADFYGLLDRERAIAQKEK